jgi:hypothetical protein
LFVSKEVAVDLNKTAKRETALCNRQSKTPTMVPDDCLLSFFQNASNALQNLDDKAYGTRLSLADCRRCILEKQKSILHQSVPNDLSIEQVQQRLAKLKNEPNLSETLKTSMNALDEAARLALCKLVLYNQTHWGDENGNRNLQTTGSMDRSRLLEFVALNRTALKLPVVTKYLLDGPPLFEDLPTPETQPTALRFPQPRLEHTQRLLSRAIGWDPEFTTRELRRLFFDNATSQTSEYSKDSEVLELFQKLMMETNQAIMNASAQASQKQLSDIDQGGVTKVVSVQYSEVIISNPEAGTFSPANAPKKLSMEQVSEDEQKRQIRLASEAAVLQQELLAELLNMPEYERTNKLDEAKCASDEFAKKVMELPPGHERLSLLQSVDPHTSRLLLMHKLWNSMLAVNGGKPPKIAKK